jgi:hypothetical protein
MAYDFDDSDREWWMADTDEELIEAVSRWEKRSRTDLMVRRRTDLIHMRLAFGPDLGGLGVGDPTSIFTPEKDRSRFNLIRMSIDTAESLIAHHKPMPQCLTVEGDFGQMRRARRETKSLIQLFQRLRVHTQMKRVFVDANSASIGVVHGYLDVDGYPQIERVHPFELWIDPAEVAANPRGFRTLGRTKLVPKVDLLEAYPTKRQDIEDYGSTLIENDDTVAMGLTTGQRDRVLCVRELWRQGRGRVPGRYVKVVGDVVLADEKLPAADLLPFVFYRFADRPSGFFGQGIAELAVDTQVRVNKLIRRIDRMQDLGSNAYVLTDGSSEVKPESITNAPLQVIRVTGRPPEFKTVSATPPDLAAQIDKEQNRLLLALGLSESSAQGERAPGVYSGAGLRANDDLQARRMASHVSRWEDAHVDVALLLRQLCDKAAKKNPDFCVDVEDSRGGAKTISTYRWADIRTPKGKRARVQVFPISSLPSTPQGKLSAITDWVQSGFVSPPFAMQLLDFPDTDQHTRFALAHLEFAQWVVEKIIDDEELVEIPPEADLKIMSDVLIRSKLQLITQGAPDTVIDLLDATIQNVAQSQGAFDQVTSANAPPPPGVGMDPAAMGGLPPEMLAGAPPAPGMPPGGAPPM